MTAKEFIYKINGGIMTDKALIEKAFEKWLEDYKSRSRCTHLDAFAGGATWQREQLEAKIREQQHFITLLGKYLQTAWTNFKCPCSDNCPCESEAWDCDVLDRDKWLTEVRNILDGKGKEYLAKLDLLSSDLDKESK